MMMPADCRSRISTERRIAIRRRGDPPARPETASRGRTLSRNLPRQPHDRWRALDLDRDLLLAQTRRALALAPRRRGGDVSLVRGQRARAVDQRWNADGN